MSQRERPATGYPREADYEKRLRSNYMQYEEWRASLAGEPATPSEAKAEPKKFRINRLDIVFVVLGVLAGLVYQSCNKAGQ